MGKGKGLTENCVMFSVMTLNIICGMLGALLFALAVWMRAEESVRDWVRELGMQQYWNGLYILMAAGIIIMLISLCGCCGAIMSNPCLLGTNVGMSSLGFLLLLMGATILLANCIRPTLDAEEIQLRLKEIFQKNDYAKDNLVIFLYYKSAILVTICIILELAGAILVIINGTEYSKLTPYLDRTFSKLILDSNYNPQANALLQTVQEKVGCCGGYNYQDYDRYKLPISDYCRDQISGNVYQFGCVQRFSLFIEKRSGWISGIALFIGLLQIILAGFSFCHWRNIRQQEKDENSYFRNKNETAALNR